MFAGRSNRTLWRSPGWSGRATSHKLIPAEEEVQQLEEGADDLDDHRNDGRWLHGAVVGGALFGKGRIAMAYSE